MFGKKKAGKRDASSGENTIMRMLSYLKPYWKTVVFCFILVILITVMELYKPILIGNAIDRYISGYDLPYRVVENGGEISYRGLPLIKETKAEDPDSLYCIMVMEGEKYYWVEGLSQEEAGLLSQGKERKTSLAGDGTLKIEAAGHSFTGQLLEKEDLKLLRGGDFIGILISAAWYLGILLLLFLCNRIQYLLLQETGQKIIYEVRQQVFDHVETLSMSYFDRTPVGKIVTRMTNDVEALHEMYANILVKLFKNSMKIIGLAGVMLLLNWRMALLSFVMLPVTAALTFLFKNLSRKAHQIVRTRYAALNTFLSENISGMKVIQIFNREGKKEEEFCRCSQALYKGTNRVMMVNAIFRPSIQLVSVIALVVVLVGGSRYVLGGTLSIGTLYIFIQYINSFFEPIQELAEQFATLQSAVASAEKIFTVLDEKPVITDPENPAILSEIRGKIEFKHVWFAYEEEDYVLKDVSFTIEPGEKVAFVGATGAGKSSILNLIGRYYDIQKGEILIDGVNIKDMSREQIRRAIGQVQQDVFLFTGTINSNIRLRDETISDEEIKKAARYVNASRFIEKLPRQYEEKVSERGATFSSGQRQLLSFARTLAYNPKILILDEATANIDTETEQWIQEALERLMTGRTSIIVAHRLSTIQHADKIMVMQKGRIRESGTHQELLKKDGIYKKLYELQLA